MLSVHEDACVRCLRPHRPPTVRRRPSQRTGAITIVSLPMKHHPRLPDKKTTTTPPLGIPLRAMMWYHWPIDPWHPGRYCPHSMWMWPPRSRPMVPSPPPQHPAPTASIPATRVVAVAATLLPIINRHPVVVPTFMRPCHPFWHPHGPRLARRRLTRGFRRCHDDDGRVPFQSTYCCYYYILQTNTRL